MVCVIFLLIRVRGFFIVRFTQVTCIVSRAVSHNKFAPSIIIKTFLSEWILFLFLFRFVLFKILVCGERRIRNPLPNACTTTSE
jgi:hypothetical protein